MYINKAIIYGNMIRDPELKTLPSGDVVTNFSLATNRAYTDKHKQKKEEVEFHNVVVYGKRAEIICQHLRKGSHLYVEGRIATKSWESDKGKQSKTEIVLESFQFGPKYQMVGQEIVEDITNL